MHGNFLCKNNVLCYYLLSACSHCFGLLYLYNIPTSTVGLGPASHDDLAWLEYPPFVLEGHRQKISKLIKFYWKQSMKIVWIKTKPICGFLRLSTYSKQVKLLLWYSLKPYHTFISSHTQKKKSDFNNWPVPITKSKSTRIVLIIRIQSS